MVQFDLINDALSKQQSKALLSNEITTELEQCIALCAKLKIDFYDCLAHARIDYEKHLRDAQH
ncbi:hypothetical protein HZU75_03685 [Chitinibacter fontanus]|uniref:Uncharacterized protein n=1 Tax=Chitinibacter fontanus TaxID=1737446 RepID=A0A7D5Z3Q8_9NEIS|nr:hypothetical protein [Chitinibacter fontanus]QLI80703.1 hypothetical protein HZU75_03685 [Chitinibacter fontanus]